MTIESKKLSALVSTSNPAENAGNICICKINENPIVSIDNRENLTVLETESMSSGKKNNSKYVPISTTSTPIISTQVHCQNYNTNITSSQRRSDTSSSTLTTEQTMKQLQRDAAVDVSGENQNSNPFEQALLEAIASIRNQNSAKKVANRNHAVTCVNEQEKPLETNADIQPPLHQDLIPTQQHHWDSAPVSKEGEWQNRQLQLNNYSERISAVRQKMTMALAAKNADGGSASLPFQPTSSNREQQGKGVPLSLDNEISITEVQNQVESILLAVIDRAKSISAGRQEEKSQENSANENPIESAVISLFSGLNIHDDTSFGHRRTDSANNDDKENKTDEKCEVAKGSNEANERALERGVDEPQEESNPVKKHEREAKEVKQYTPKVSSKPNVFSFYEATTIDDIFSTARVVEEPVIKAAKKNENKFSTSSAQNNDEVANTVNRGHEDAECSLKVKDSGECDPEPLADATRQPSICINYGMMGVEAKLSDSIDSSSSDNEEASPSAATKKNLYYGVLGPLSVEDGGTTGVVLFSDDEYDDNNASTEDGLGLFAKDSGPGIVEVTTEDEMGRNDCDIVEMSTSTSHQSSELTAESTVDFITPLACTDSMVNMVTNGDVSSSNCGIFAGTSSPMDTDEEDALDDKELKEFKEGEDANLLMRQLCAHLLPFGVTVAPEIKTLRSTDPISPSSLLNVFSECLSWEDNNDDGYTVMRLSKSQLQSVEREFEASITAFRIEKEGELMASTDYRGKRRLRRSSSHGTAGSSFGRKSELSESDDCFEKDLAAAETLLDQEESRAKAVAASMALGGGEEAAGVASTSAFAPASPSSPSSAITQQSENRWDEGSSATSSSDSDTFWGGVTSDDIDDDDKGNGSRTSKRRGKVEDVASFDLPIIYSRGKTGFESEKDLLLQTGMIIAGRFLVEGVLGSAAFSTAYRCIDLTEEDEYDREVCLKVIKNTKDYFDQSLDEIKMLSMLQKSGKCHTHNLLEMKSFFYYREHLVIVTELLRQDLFEFGKFILDNKEPPYFTRRRLCYITRQILVALDCIHKMDIVHCDVKPENILLSSYSKARAKLIDFGSSCFTSDRLSSYIQSRSYRAPEVILGLPYDGKIDIWSLGCVVCEMYTGDVIFQNDSVITMLARIEAICGAFPRHMVAEGKQSHAYFMPSGLLYEEAGKNNNDSSGLDASIKEGNATNNDSNEKYYDIFKPKMTTLAARIGFQPEDLQDESKSLFNDFIQSLLTIDPDCRPTAAEALQHPWIRSSLAFTEDHIRYPQEKSK